MAAKKPSKKLTKSSNIAVEPEILDAESPSVVDEEKLASELPVIEVSRTEDSAKDNLLSAEGPGKEVALYDKDFISKDPLSQYIQEIQRYPLLSIDQEKALTKALVESGDVEIAKKLVLANLRLVVKIAMEYRSAHSNVMDLIQEGNIGLMKAVSKYDPTKGAKLSYYASWWIKSYVLKFILDNFRLVKIGTTNEQKKLFYNLLREKNRLIAMGITPDSKQISENLGVSEKAVITMDQRLLHGGDVSLDAPSQESEGGSLLGTLADTSASVEDEVSQAQELGLLKESLGKFVESLRPRDRKIFEERLLSELPPSLQVLADEYGVSRERIRQIEARLLGKLKVYMQDILR